MSVATRTSHTSKLAETLPFIKSLRIDSNSRTLLPHCLQFIHMSSCSVYLSVSYKQLHYILVCLSNMISCSVYLFHITNCIMYLSVCPIWSVAVCTCLSHMSSCIAYLSVSVPESTQIKRVILHSQQSEILSHQTQAVSSVLQVVHGLRPNCCQLAQSHLPQDATHLHPFLDKRQDFKVKWRENTSSTSFQIFHYHYIQISCFKVCFLICVEHFDLHFPVIKILKECF